MAKFTKDEFISGLKEMTILEVKELVDAMKEPNTYPLANMRAIIW